MGQTSYIHISHEIMLELNTMMDAKQCTMKAANVWLLEQKQIRITDKAFRYKVHSWREKNGFLIYGRKGKAHEMTEEQKAAHALKVQVELAKREWNKQQAKERQAPVFGRFEDEDPRVLDVGLNRGRHWL